MADVEIGRRVHQARMVTAAPSPGVLIGRRLRELRAWRGLSLRALGELAGYSKSALSTLERGERPLERLTTIAALATALRVPPSALLDEFPGGQLVQYLVEHPAALDAARDEHRRGPDARCRVCPPTQSGRRPYPCYVREAADRAAELRHRDAAG